MRNNTTVKKNKKLFRVLAVWLFILIAVIVLAALNPPMKRLAEEVPETFVAEAKATTKGFADYEFRLGILNLYRAKNLQNADTYNVLGIAGQVVAMNGDVSKSVANVISYIPALGEGARTTLLLTVLSTTVGLIGGIFFALGKIVDPRPKQRGLIPWLIAFALRIYSWFCKAYIFFFRGTPLLMQLYFIYFGLPMINKSLTINDRFTAAFLALMLNSFAYCAEIVRAAIQSIDKGQYEAARSLGFSYGQTMRLVVLPQSVRRALPPVANEFIMVIKDCAIVSMISLSDLMKVTTNVMNSNVSTLVFFPSAVMYLIMTAFFTYVFNKLEKRFSVYQ